MQTAKHYAPLAVRILLGLVFTVFGLNGFLNFISPPETTAAGGAFLGALAATGYMFPLVKGTELVVGLMLLSGHFVPLALVLLAPITVNILLFHVVLAPAPGLPLVLLGGQLFLAYVHREAYAGLLRASGSPAAEGFHAPQAARQSA